MFSVANTIDYLSSTYALGTLGCSWGVGATRYVLIKSKHCSSCEYQCSIQLWTESMYRNVDCVSSSRI